MVRIGLSNFLFDFRGFPPYQDCRTSGKKNSGGERRTVLGVAENRRKWNRRYLEPKRFQPVPHALGEQWGHRFIGGRMLDAACGLGRGIATGREAFQTVFAADISDVAVFRARKLWKHDRRIRWIVADATCIEWPQDFFGLACAFAFTDLPFFARLRGAVVPGGMFLYEGFSLRQRELKPQLNEDWTSTPERMREIFAGWEILTCEESGEAPYRVRFAAIRTP